MGKKLVVAIILAIILAVVYSVLKIDNKNQDVSLDNLSQQEELAENEVALDVIPVEIDTEEAKTDKTNIVCEKKQVNNEIKKSQESIQEDSVVQEATIVQEAEPDYGVRIIANNVIEVTREFKYKSPTTYSFKDYGFLYKVK